MSTNDSASAIPAPPSVWRDLSHEVAVIASAPGYFYPSGGHRDAGGNWIEAPDDTAEKFEPFAALFLRIVSEERSPGGQSIGIASPTIDRYHPNAYGTGGPYESVAILISLISDANSTVQTLTAWLQLGEYVLRLKNAWRWVFQQAGIPLGDSDGLILSASSIEAACLHHAYVTYAKPGEPISIETVYRPIGAGSSSHPTGEERYTIQVGVGATTYLYIVDGYLKPLDHLSISSEVITPLDLPNFGEYGATTDMEGAEGKPLSLSSRRIAG